MCRIVEEITSIHSYIVNLGCHSVISQTEFGKLETEMKSLAGLQKQVLINKAEFSVFCFVLFLIFLSRMYGYLRQIK